jgi:hypothetical protein
MLKLGQHGYEYVYHPHHLYNKIAKNINTGVVTPQAKLSSGGKRRTQKVLW